MLDFSKAAAEGSLWAQAVSSTRDGSSRAWGSVKCSVGHKPSLVEQMRIKTLS